MARKGRVGSSPTPGTKIANKYRPHSTATRFRRLLAKTEGMKAIDITTASVGRYKTLRLKENVAPATVNRELAALKRMFRLGLRQRAWWRRCPTSRCWLSTAFGKDSSSCGPVPGHPEASPHRSSRAVRGRLHRCASGRSSSRDWRCRYAAARFKSWRDYGTDATGGGQRDRVG